MNVYAISDLHLSAAQDKPMDVFGGAWYNYWGAIKNNCSHIGQDDVILIAGDLSWGMKLDDALPDLLDIATLPGTKIVVKGNHDYWWSSPRKIREVLPDSIRIIQNDATKIGKFVFAGTRGWICPDVNYKPDDMKIFEREVERMKLSLNAAEKLMTPEDTLVVMTHFPPFNVRREQNAMTDLLESRGVRTVVYGHLHGKNCRSDKKYTANGVSYYLTSCDQISNNPVKIF
ncbi:MAG: metallophosphoesterase [Christensenellales bacterium]